MMKSTHKMKWYAIGMCVYVTQGFQHLSDSHPSDLFVNTFPSIFLFHANNKIPIS